MPSVLCKPLFITRTCSNLEICAEQNQQLCFCCTEISVCAVCTRVCSKCFITAPGPAVLTDRCDLTFDTCPSAQCSHPPCRAPGTTPLFCFHGSQLSGSFGIQFFFCPTHPYRVSPVTFGACRCVQGSTPASVQQILFSICLFRSCYLGFCLLWVSSDRGSVRTCKRAVITGRTCKHAMISDRQSCDMPAVAALYTLANNGVPGAWRLQ